MRVARMGLARTWLVGLGIALVITAVLGLVPQVVTALHGLGLHLEAGEDATHWVLGLAALGIAFAVRGERTVGVLAMAFGVVLLLVGGLGLAAPRLGPWHVGMADNLFHFVLGSASLLAGAATREPDELRGAARGY